MVKRLDRKTIYFTIVIDIVGSRTRFVDQNATGSFINYMINQLNAEFLSKIGEAKFNQKDGDSIMIVLQEGFENMVFQIYQYCNTLYYKSGFQQYASTKLLKKKTLEFYFSVGVGTIDTSVDKLNNVDVVNGTSISRATEGITISKKITSSKTSPAHFKFKKSPFKFYINSTSGNAAQLNADTVIALFYLLYEKILNTQNKKIAYSLLYPNRQIKNFELARELYQNYGIESYNVDYNDARQRAQVSSKISLMVAPVKREPIKVVQISIIKSLINVRKELTEVQ